MNKTSQKANPVQLFVYFSMTDVCCENVWYAYNAILKWLRLSTNRLQSGKQPWRMKWKIFPYLLSVDVVNYAFFLAATRSSNWLFVYESCDMQCGYQVARNQCNSNDRMCHNIRPPSSYIKLVFHCEMWKYSILVYLPEFISWYLEHFLWNWSYVSVTEPWWGWNISSCTGLVSSTNKSLHEPMLIQTYVAMRGRYATMIKRYDWPVGQNNEKENVLYHNLFSEYDIIFIAMGWPFVYSTPLIIIITCQYDCSMSTVNSRYLNPLLSLQNVSHDSPGVRHGMSMVYNLLNCLPLPLPCCV